MKIIINKNSDQKLVNMFNKASKGFKQVTRKPVYKDGQLHHFEVDHIKEIEIINR